MPTKAAYLKFETEPDYFFDFFLAEKLGMTVEDVRERISMEEWTAWTVYHARKAQQRELAMRKR